MSEKLQVYLNKRGTLKDKKVHRSYSKNVHPVRRYTVLFDKNLGRPFPFMFLTNLPLSINPVKNDWQHC